MNCKNIVVYIYESKEDMSRKSINDDNLSRGKNFVKICEILFQGDSRRVIGAKLGGVSEGTIRNWEEGKPIANKALSELERRGVSLAWLFRNEGEMFLVSSASTQATNVFFGDNEPHDRGNADAAPQAIDLGPASRSLISSFVDLAVLRNCADRVYHHILSGHPESIELASHLQRDADAYEDLVARLDREASTQSQPYPGRDSSKRKERKKP